MKDFHLNNGSRQGQNLALTGSSTPYQVLRTVFEDGSVFAPIEDEFKDFLYSGMSFTPTAEEKALSVRPLFSSLPRYTLHPETYTLHPTP